MVFPKGNGRQGEFQLCNKRGERSQGFQSVELSGCVPQAVESLTEVMVP